MASSSSAKKVARVAAKSGPGSSANKQANWLFPAAILVIVALGVGIVVYARSENGGGGDNAIAPRAQLSQGEPGDHWHAAFSVSVCGKELAAVPQTEPDPLGIHTHADGLIHIHPFATRAAGRNATMKRFLDQVLLKVTDTGFELPETMEVSGADGQRVQEGETTCGGEEGELVLAHWKDATTAATSEPDEIIRDDFPSVRFTEDLGAYTLAFVKKGDTDIAPPSASAQIEQLGAQDGGATATDGAGSTESSTPGGTGETSVPAEGSTPATDAPADTTATTAAAE